VRQVLIRGHWLRALGLAVARALKCPPSRLLPGFLLNSPGQMRFLMLNWRDPRNPLAGGAERVTLGYLAALAKRGHEVFWFAYTFEGAKPDDQIDGVQIIRRGGVGSAILEARRWLRTQGPFDLVIDQHHGWPWFPHGGPGPNVWLHPRSDGTHWAFLSLAN